jgi:hypothetical protein
VTKEVPLPEGSGTGVVYAAGSIWVAGGSQTFAVTVTRVNPQTGGTTSLRVPGAAPQDIVSAYGAVWVEDTRNDRLLRVDPATNHVTTVPLRATGLGFVLPTHVFVADGKIVVVSACCAPAFGYSQLGTVDRHGTFTVFFATKGPINAASDGTDLWLDGGGALRRYRVSHATADLDTWSPEPTSVRAGNGPLFATRRSVWVLASAADGPQRFDRATGRMQRAVALPRGRIDLTPTWGNWASDGSHVWLLDGRRGVVYELRD